ncbi:hypothetical protein IEQ34_010828 [Dendrobium chrysotoxum]|uniref:Uncharacterized protein n=1 Tax=Dendrobium chrysotoxum TaxID=161865 RepID=A0AAV7GVR0_DENCH|nr:hypothetical protein IEQ34_010828 [Dendrobium chrysotoxum]
MKKRLIKIEKCALQIDPNLKRLEDIVKKLDKIPLMLVMQEQLLKLYKIREAGSFPKNDLISIEKVRIRFSRLASLHNIPLIKLDPNRLGGLLEVASGEVPNKEEKIQNECMQTLGSRHNHSEPKELSLFRVHCSHATSIGSRLGRPGLKFIVLDDIHIILDNQQKIETLIRATELRGSD